MNKNLTKQIKNKLNLLKGQLGKEYNYSCMPLAIIDAVYSIRQEYKKVRAIVNNYCTYYNIAVYKDESNANIHTVSDLIKNIEEVGTEVFAKDILHCNNKTAGANPMIKSQAVYEFAKVLKDNGIECFKDFAKTDIDKLEKELLNIHGQGQAVIRYFFMLCGDDNFCKYDRHIKNFLEEINADVENADEAQALLERIVKELKKDYPTMTVRLLDHLIWNYQRSRT